MTEDKELIRLKRNSRQAAFNLFWSVLRAYAQTQAWNEKQFNEQYLRCRNQIIKAKNKEISILAQASVFANALHDVSGEILRQLDHMGYHPKNQNPTEAIIV